MSTIKILTLYKDLLFSLNEEEIDTKDECLFTFDDTFKKGAELQQGEYLKNKQFLGFSSKEKTENSAIIPQGKYMFLQQESATDFSQEERSVTLKQMQIIRINIKSFFIFFSFRIRLAKYIW